MIDEFGSGRVDGWRGASWQRLARLPVVYHHLNNQMIDLNQAEAASAPLPAESHASSERMSRTPSIRSQDARLVHLNGPPGIGKSTLSALYADRHPGTLNLDVDTLHHLIGGWQDEETDTWPVVWSLARAMAATHLDGGRDVVLPQYSATVDEIAGFEELARKHGAAFREVVLLDDRQAAIERFHHRARDSDDPWIRHHHRLIEVGGGPVLLGTMYDNLMEVVRLHPGAAVVPSAAGAVRETYERLASALREPV